MFPMTWVNIGPLVKQFHNAEQSVTRNNNEGQQHVAIAVLAVII